MLDFSVVDHPHGLAFAAGDAFGFCQLNLCGHTEQLFDILSDAAFQFLQFADLVGKNLLSDFHLDGQNIQVPFPVAADIQFAEPAIRNPVS